MEDEDENEKNEKEEKNKISEKSRSGKAVDKGVEVPYLVVPSKKKKIVIWQDFWIFSGNWK